MSLTTDPNDRKLKEGQKNKTGQHEIYLVLSEEERAKGFVRPYRESYVHTGKQGYKICGKNLRILDAQDEFYPKYYAVVCCAKPDCTILHENGRCISGSFLTKEQYEQAISGNYNEKKGCGTITTMGRALSETYATNPKFYGATFCCHCNTHLPVEEFMWCGTNEKVGS